MRITFVCTGNICRSPMGELMLRQHIQASGITGIDVTSAGTRGLSSHLIDPSSAKILASLGIDSSAFRSKRLTKAIADEADLILCFEANHRKQIAEIAPLAVRKTFVLTEFAQLSEYALEHDVFNNSDTLNEKYRYNPLDNSITVVRRLNTLLKQSTLFLPMLPTVEDIADPYGKKFEYFLTAADHTYQTLRRIIVSLGLC